MLEIRMQFLCLLAIAVAAGPFQSAARAQDAAVVAPILRRAVVTIKVSDFSAASRQIHVAASSQSAVLEDARTTVSGNGHRSGWMRLRVPADRLPQMVAEASRAGVLYSEKLATEDDASRYDSLAVRADRLQQHEARLDSVLSSERRLRGSDILFVQERLFRAGVDESLLRQDRIDLARKSRSSSLLIFLFEPAPTRTQDRVERSVSAQFGYARQRAAQALSASVRRFVTAAAYAAVYAPIWIALAALPILLLVRYGRSLRRLLRSGIGRLLRRSAPASSDTVIGRLPAPMSGPQP